METGCGLIWLSVTPSRLPFQTEKRKKWKWKMEKVETVGVLSSHIRHFASNSSGATAAQSQFNINLLF